MPPARADEAASVHFARAARFSSQSAKSKVECPSPESSLGRSSTVTRLLRGQAARLMVRACAAWTTA